MTTKTKTTTTKTSAEFSEVVAKANADAIAKKAETAQAIEEGELRVLDLETAMMVSEQLADDIEAKWKSGDTEPTALEHAAALSEHVKAVALHTGEAARVAGLVRVSPNTDKLAADVIAGPLREALGELVQVHTSSVKIEDTPQAAELPRVLLVQSKPTDYKPDGSLAGDLELTYHHVPALHREITEEALEDAAASAGFNVSATMRPSLDGRQLVRLTLRYGYDGVPRITRPLPIERLGLNLAQAIAGVLAGPTGASGARGTSQKPDGSVEGYYIKARVGAVESSTISVDEGGARTERVNITVLADERYGRDIAEVLGGENPVVTLVAELVADHKGKLLAGHGRVVEASVQRVANRDHKYAFDISFTLVSSV